MLESRPDSRDVDHASLALALDTLQDVVTAATTCADACLSEPDVGDRVDCVRACHDAADVATALLRVLSRTGPTVMGSRALIDAGAKMLSETAEVTGAHGGDDKHCRLCSETCSRAQQALAGLQTAVASASES